MKKFVAASLLTLLFAGGCSYFQSKSDTENFVRDGGRLSAESREFTKIVNGKKVSVYFIDMIHIGPKNFYDNVQNYLKEKARGKKAIVAAEGFFCDSPTGNDTVYSIANASRFDKSLFPQGSFDDEEDSNESSLDAYTDMSSEDIEKIVASGFLKKETCKSLNKKPSISSTYQRIASQFDLVTQRDSHLYGNLNVYRADLNLTSLKGGDRVLFSAFSSCLGDESCLSSPFMTWANGKDISLGSVLAKRVIDNIIVSRRNDSLISNINLLANDYDVIFAPWGSAHMTELYQKLPQIGFEASGIQKVEFAKCTLVTSNLVLSRMSDFMRMCQ